MRSAVSPARRAPSLSAFVALLAAWFAGCTADGNELFGTSGAGGAGGAGGEGGGWTSASSSSGSASASSSSASSSSASSSSASSSSASGSSSSSSGGGTVCAHDVCSTGDALEQGCDPCVDQVCAQDAFCCMNNWDGQCVQQAGQLCNVGCCGNGKCEGEDCGSCPQDCGVCPTCPHSVCFVGSALDPNQCRDACVDQTCAQESSCCSGQPGWNASCSALAESLCDADTCITSVCADMPSCCSNGWTQACVDAAKMKCDTGCDCAHSLCQNGEKLTAGCNPCAASVCKVDPYCCGTAWDNLCVGEVGSVCGINCN